MKKEEKGQRHLRKQNNKNMEKNSNSGSSRNQSARRFPTKKIYCITYLAFRTNV